MPAGGLAVLSRAAWASVSRHYDRGARCSLDWDRRRRVTPVQTTSPEAWPEAEPHREVRRLLNSVCRRSASFIYL